MHDPQPVIFLTQVHESCLLVFFSIEVMKKPLVQTTLARIQPHSATQSCIMYKTRHHFSLLKTSSSVTVMSATKF